MTLEVRTVPLDDLVPDAGNTRVHGVANLRAISNSLRRWGQTEPLVVRKGTSVVIAGNGRLEAMKSLGWTECDVVELDLESAEAVALSIAMNRTGDLATFDEHALAAALVGLEAEDAELREVAGFTAEEMRALSDAACEFGDVAPGELPEALAASSKEFMAVTFVIHEDHKPELDAALRAARDLPGCPDADEVNPNKNGAALIALCRTLAGEHVDG